MLHHDHGTDTCPRRIVPTFRRSCLGIDIAWCLSVIKRHSTSEWVVILDVKVYLKDSYPHQTAAVNESARRAGGFKTIWPVLL